jgi:carbon monoxide dehydrogenase subunit G
MSKSSQQKVIYSPGRQEQVYAALWDLKTFLSRNPRVVIVKSEENAVEAEMSIRTGFRTYQREFVKIRSEPVDGENLVIRGEGGNLKFTIHFRVVGIGFATHVEVSLECESLVRNLCGQFASDMMDYIEDFVKRPPSVEFKAPIPSKKPETPPPAPVKPPQVAPAPTTVTPAGGERREVPGVEARLSFDRVKHLLDYTTLATLVMNATLIGRVTLNQPWGRREVEDLLKERLALLKDYALVVLSVRGVGEAYILADNMGNLVAGLAEISGNLISGAGDAIGKIIEQLGKQPATIRIWGVKEIPAQV